MKHTRTQLGAVAVELLVVSPFLLLILFTCLQAGLLLQTSQSLVFAAREAGNLLLRECVYTQGGNPQLDFTEATESCSEDLLTKVRSLHRSDLPAQSWFPAKDDLRLTAAVFACNSRTCIPCAGTTGGCEVCTCTGSSELSFTSADGPVSPELIDPDSAKIREVLDEKGFALVIETSAHHKLFWEFPIAGELAHATLIF